MQRFYFDHNATTPIALEVREAIIAALDVYGNASSIHYYGQTAKQEYEAARERVAALLHGDPRGLVFTSGGTEADNLAILGVARAREGARHVITSAIEHPGVLNACAQLEREGVDVTRIAPGPDGIVDPAAVRAALRPSTVLVSVMHANNELGTLQPIAEIAAVAHQAGALMHSDGVQALGKVPVDVAALDVDLYSVSAHKVYAPKGTGALWIRKGTPLAPIGYGGRHEGGRRPGTENVPGAVAFGAAAVLAARDLAAESARLSALRDRLEEGILARIPHTAVNGSRRERTPNTANIRFDFVEGEALLIALDLAGFAVSSGAACSSGAVHPSHVLTAIGLTREQARGTLRFSLGRTNTEEQVNALLDALAASVERLRRISAERDQ